jgi:hypothetical protein
VTVDTSTANQRTITILVLLIFIILTLDITRRPTPELTRELPTSNLKGKLIASRIE